MIFLFLFPPIGVLFLGVGFLLIIIVIGTKKADILDNWSILIQNAHGQRDTIISTTKELIAESKAPSVMLSDEKVGPSLALTSFGETRDFLIVTNRVNPKLSNFKVFVNANDYGEHLFVDWNLTYRPDFLHALVMLLPGVKKIACIEDLNLFDKQDLTAYVTDVHNRLNEAVGKLMLDMNQDPSKIDRKARGFLGIS